MQVSAGWRGLVQDGYVSACWVFNLGVLIPVVLEHLVSYVPAGPVP